MELAARMPECAALLPGLRNPQINAHGPDDSMPLDDMARFCVTETLLLELLGARHG